MKLYLFIFFFFEDYYFNYKSLVLVIFHYNAGKPEREIVRIINRSRTTVEYILKRYKSKNRTSTN